MNDKILFSFCVAGFIAAAAFSVSRMFVRGNDTKLRQRLAEAPNPGEPTLQQQQQQRADGLKRGFVPVMQQIGQAAAKPFMPTKRENQSSLRKRLGHAGIYTPSAVRILTGFKVILLGLGLVVGYGIGLFLDNMMLGLPVGGLGGYLAPTFWLNSRIKNNQRFITQALPDALDLMVVCVEAGLTVDAAMQRVGMELQIAHPALSRELGIAHMETRVGLSRVESLRNLAQRTGNAALQSLVAMLIQADRFGTSIASALRVHADSLRVARQHAAEEMAAKASVKLTFPIVLFIFPATFIVLAGPIAIQLMRSSW